MNLIRANIDLFYQRPTTMNFVFVPFRMVHAFICPDMEDKVIYLPLHHESPFWVVFASSVQNVSELLRLHPPQLFMTRVWTDVSDAKRILHYQFSHTDSTGGGELQDVAEEIQVFARSGMIKGDIGVENHKTIPFSEVRDFFYIKFFVRKYGGWPTTDEDMVKDFENCL